MNLITIVFAFIPRLRVFKDARTDHSDTAEIQTS